MVAKVMTGARAKIFVNGKLVGLFDSCNFTTNVTVEPIHILGRFSPAEITPVAQEAVTVNCSGFRIIGNGAHILPKFPKLQDLLKLENVTISITDRQSTDNKPILTVIGCVPVSYNVGYNAKATSRISISYTGLRAADESGAQDEGGANTLP